MTSDAGTLDGAAAGDALGAPGSRVRSSFGGERLERACLAELALRGDEHILDVGSGDGRFARALARGLGAEGSLVAVEGSLDRLAAARAHARDEAEEGLVEFRQGSAPSLPLAEEERGSFDLVHARFLLEHVRDPAGVAASLVAATRPGGRIVLVDDDHDRLELWPEAPAVSALWRAYIRTHDRLGHDPYVGRRLVQLLHEGGAHPTRVTVVPWSSCAGSADWQATVDDLAGVLGGARALMLAAGVATDAHVDAGLDELTAWSRRPEASLWYGLCWAEGRH